MEISSWFYKHYNVDHYELHSFNFSFEEENFTYKLSIDDPFFHPKSRWEEFCDSINKNEADKLTFKHYVEEEDVMYCTLGFLKDDYIYFIVEEKHKYTSNFRIPTKYKEEFLKALRHLLQCNEDKTYSNWKDDEKLYEWFCS